LSGGRVNFAAGRGYDRASTCPSRSHSNNQEIFEEGMEVVRLKPHLQVKDEMARFMTEVATAFAGRPA
jgi:hypothetical protein